MSFTLRNNKRRLPAPHRGAHFPISHIYVNIVVSNQSLPHCSDRNLPRYKAMASNSAFADTSDRNQRLEYRNESDADDADQTFAPQPLFGKCNTKLIKKGGEKVVAAMKSLQCSPRAGGKDYEKLETKERKNIVKDNAFSSTKSNENPHGQQQEEYNDQKPVFVANVDRFESMRDILDILDNLGEKNVPTQRICNDLEIFTNVTDDSLDDDRGRNNNEQHDDQYDDIVDNLRNITRPSLDRDHNVDDGFSSPPRSNQKLLTQTELNYFSNNSNDTPVTCNKSLAMTPNNEHLYLSRKDEKNDGDDNDTFGKPPKELLHHSLSLGDAISPAEHIFDHDNGATKHRHSRIEDLNLPVLDRGKGVLDSSAKDGNSVRKIGQINKFQYSSSLFSEQSDVGSTGTGTQSLRSTLQDDVSPMSSTISSFVFSSDGGHNTTFETSQTTDNLESISSALFRKTYQREYKGRQMQRRANHLVVNSKHTPPAFFWKTHPRFTIKSYQ